MNMTKTKKIKAKIFTTVAAAGATISALSLPVLAATGTGIDDVDALGEWITKFLTGLQSNLSAVLLALASITLLVMLGLWMITTNEKKTDIYRKKFFTVFIIVAAIAAISAIITIATSIGTNLNETITGA